MRPLLSNIACPSPETLSAFLLGDLPETQLSEVAAHVSACAACEEQAGQLDPASDEIVECLRRLPNRDPEIPPPDADPNSSSEMPTLPPATECWGEFRIVREIGRGGMGVVCEAYQGSLNRHVALKFLPEHGDLARFRREARAAGRLHHTNIVPVFGVGEQQGRHFYVMQYIAGRGLDAVLKERAGTGGLTGTVRRPRGGPDRRPGGRGAGLCSRPGRHPPRHQAVEPVARRAGDRLGHRLRPGPRCQRYPHTDAHRRLSGDIALLGSGAVQRPRGRAGGYLRAGRHALRAGLRPSGVRGGGPVGAGAPDSAPGPAPSAAAAAGDRPRPGDDRR